MASSFGVAVLAAAMSFQDPIPESPSTTEPAATTNDYWRSEFERVNREVAEADHPQLVFFGDSITLGWSGPKAAGNPVWQKRFAKYDPINMGNSGDITPVMLYRLRHGNLDFAKRYDVLADAIEPVIERFIEAGPVEPEDPRAPRSIPRP